MKLIYSNVLGLFIYLFDVNIVPEYTKKLKRKKLQ